MPTHSHAHGHHAQHPSLSLPKALFLGDIPLTISKRLIQGLVELRSKGVKLYSTSREDFETQKKRVRELRKMNPAFQFDVLLEKESACSCQLKDFESLYVLTLPEIGLDKSLLRRAYETLGFARSIKRSMILVVDTEAEVQTAAKREGYKVLSVDKETFETQMITLLQKLEILDVPANRWTRIGAVTGFSVDFVTNATLFAGMLMYFSSNEDPEELGYTFRNLAWGLIYGFLVAVSTTYCHYVLESQVQMEETEKGKDWDDNFLNFKDPFPLDEDPKIQLAGDDLDQSRRTSLRYSLSRKQGKGHDHDLYGYQKLALVGDAFGHMGDLAGPFIAYARIFGSSTLSPMHQWMVNGGIFLLSILGSGSDFRTCLMALLKKEDTLEEEKADFFTVFGTLMTIMVEFVNSATVFADIFPDFFPATDDFLGYSKEALIFGIPVGFCIAAAGTYCDYWLHKATQSGQGLMNTRHHVEGVQLPFWKKAILGGNALCLLSGYASPLILAWNICGLEDLPRSPRLAVTFATLGLTSFGVVSKFVPHYKAVLKGEMEAQHQHTNSETKNVPLLSDVGGTGAPIDLTEVV